MKTLEQAARLALEALEDSHQNINPERGFAEELQQQIAQAITALREALEQQQEPYDQQALELCPECGWKALIPGDGCLICERTAQQQAPVAYIAWRDGKPCWDGDDCVCEDAVWPVDGDDDRESMPVYLAPQQRKPLTAREIELIDGMIEVQLNHAERCDNIPNRPMAEKQKSWDMERVELLRKLKAAHGIKE